MKKVIPVLCAVLIMVGLLYMMSIQNTSGPEPASNIIENETEEEFDETTSYGQEIISLHNRISELWDINHVLEAAVSGPIVTTCETCESIAGGSDIESEVKESSIIEIIPKIKPGVVHIFAPDWQGSGFVVGKNMIATARHCVEGVEDFVITTNDGHVLHATRAISSEKHDVAFIYIDDLVCQLEKGREIECDKIKHKVKLHVLKLGSITECQLGQELITIGSPFGKVNFNSVTLGIISGLDRNYNPLNYWGDDYGWSVAFQTDSPGHPGNSGCAVFTADGVVRGVLVGGFSPSLIIAMPVDIFLDELEEIERLFIQDTYYREEEVPNYYDAAYEFFTAWKKQ